MSLSTLRDFDDPSTILYGTCLNVKESTIRNAGKGLFTRHSIRERTIICEYFGDIVRRENLHNFPNKNYMASNGLNGEQEIIINGLNAQGKVVCAAAFINDPFDGDKWNCDFHWVGNRCFIRTNQDIDEHSELFIPYGGDYWFSPEFFSCILIEACEAYSNETDYEDWGILIEEAVQRENARAAAVEAAMVTVTNDLIIQVTDELINQVVDEVIPVEFRLNLGYSSSSDDDDEAVVYNEVEDDVVSDLTFEDPNIIDLTNIDDDKVEHREIVDLTAIDDDDEDEDDEDEDDDEPQRRGGFEESKCRRGRKRKTVYNFLPVMPHEKHNKRRFLE